MGRKRYVKGLLTLSVALILVWVSLDIRMRPLVREYALNQGRVLASEAMAKAVETVLAEEDALYDRLVSVKRNSEGGVLSVEADTAAINRLSARVVTALGDRLAMDDYTTMTVPLFSATGSSFLAGRGPDVTVRIQQNGAATTQMHSHFAAAGINQTLHRLELTVTFRTVVLVAGMSEAVEISGTYLVAETVIVGTVPDRYVGIERNE